MTGKRGILVMGHCPLLSVLSMKVSWIFYRQKVTEEILIPDKLGVQIVNMYPVVNQYVQNLNWIQNVRNLVRFLNGIW